METLYGVHPVREALRAGRRKLLRLRVRERGRDEVRDLVERAQTLELAIEDWPEGGESQAERSQGVELDAGPLPESDLAGLLAGLGEGPNRLVALDGVEDPQNVGAIARVADAAGVGGLILTDRRAPPLSPALSRASAGAIEHLAVARVPNLSRAINTLKEKGFWAFGGDHEEGEELFSVPDRVLSGNAVLVLGAEGRGIRPGVAATLDHRLRIPMAGRVASLNVAAAAAVILFEFRRRNGVAGEP